MRIAFVHYPGRLARLDAARAGDGPTEFLFGAVELERAGHEVTHHEVDPAAPAGPVARRAIDLQAGKRRLPPHLSASVLRQTGALLPALRTTDVVVATTTGTAVALGTWRTLGRLTTPLVGIVAGLNNDPWSRSRRATTLPILRHLHSVLYGPGELVELVGTDDRLRDRVHVDRFGVDTAFWCPAPDGEPSRGVLAIGNDGSRDWPTLVQAAATIDAPVRILTSHARPTALPANVDWEPADWHRRLLSDEEVRQAYRDAGVVVVPVRDVPQPSGQSVSLQALACGRPLVLTRTQGLWDESLAGIADATLVPPSDPAALAAGITARLDSAPDGSGRSWVVRHGAVAGFADRLLAICELAIREP